MPPKRKRTGKLEDPETEGLYPEVGIEEDERTGPKKRGRKSIIDAILQEEGTLTSSFDFSSDIFSPLKPEELPHPSCPRTSGRSPSFIHRTWYRQRILQNGERISPVLSH